jgi:cobalamin biosynthesis Mg chelatase CobN
MTNGTFPSGWYRDPTGQGEARYWNGAAWTDSVNRGGVTVSVPIDADQAQLPPAPGSEVRVTAPAAAPAETSSRRSPLAVIFGILAVVLLVVVIVLLVTDDDSDDPQPPVTGVPTAPVTDPPSTG